MSSSICIKLEKETTNTNGGWKSSEIISNWAYPGDADEFENILDDCDFLDCTTADEESVTYEGSTDGVYRKLVEALSSTKYANLLPAPPAGGRWDDAELTLTLYY